MSSLLRLLEGRTGQPVYEFLELALGDVADLAATKRAPELPILSLEFESAEELARLARRAWAIRVADAVASETLAELGGSLSTWADSVLAAMLHEVQGSFDIVAVGGYGVLDLTLHNDLDVVFFVESLTGQEYAEQKAREFLALGESLRQFGVPMEIDARVRSDRSPGLFVRAHEGFRLYQLSIMSMAERYVLGQSRLVCGSPKVVPLVHEAAYGQPLTPERLDELLRSKLLMETERVPTKYARRHVRFGIGGLSDIAWLVRLNEMRYPTATGAGENVTFDDRLRALARARLINAFELETMLEARRHLIQARTQIALFGFTPDVLPENPERLDRMAHVFGLGDGNAFLSLHERVIESVRAIFNEGIERLRA